MNKVVHLLINKNCTMKKKMTAENASKYEKTCLDYVLVDKNKKFIRR